MSMKNPPTPAGIEPATFRFVVQHLNHYATAVPLFSQKTSLICTLFSFFSFNFLCNLSVQPSVLQVRMNSVRPSCYLLLLINQVTDVLSSSDKKFILQQCTSWVWGTYRVVSNVVPCESDLTYLSGEMKRPAT